MHVEYGKEFIVVPLILCSAMSPGALEGLFQVPLGGGRVLSEVL